MAVDYSQIGAFNQALVVALKTGATHASGYPIADYRHAMSYNYDLSFGMYGINNKKPLPGSYVGTKYYCYRSDNTIDMKKRIVHIHDPVNPTNPETFYRLIHTKSDPDARDNSYSNCDLITNIP